MNTLLLAIMAAALVALLVLLLFPRRHGEEGEAQASEDARVSPLLRGINYLLSDQPDRALQEMVQVARLRSEAADVYMALGEMFRARGEYGRAVRIHQNLLARPGLSPEMKRAAQYALAVDFQTGGLLDRALKQYRKLLELEPDHVPALKASLRIREQSHEWLEAEALLSRLEQVQNRSYHEHRAYLFAQMAEKCLRDGDDEQAGTYARKAIELAPGCAPACFVLIELALRDGRWPDAERMMRSLAEHNREHFPLVVPLLLRFEQVYRDKGRALLMEIWRDTHDEELALSWLEHVGAADRQQARALLDELGFKPANLRARLRVEAVFEDERNPIFARAWRRQVNNYICEQCGVGVKELRWQCPQCHAWGSMHPQKGDIA
ncbi:MAG: heat-shock protein [Zetaproteobacteria bacterium]|nr:MAG: heat-shock protein [Zetaproteobacteria bacterium]